MLALNMGDEHLDAPLAKPREHPGRRHVGIAPALVAGDHDPRRFRRKVALLVEQRRLDGPDDCARLAPADDPVQPTPRPARDLPCIPRAQLVTSSYADHLPPLTAGAAGDSIGAAHALAAQIGGGAGHQLIATADRVFTEALGMGLLAAAAVAAAGAILIRWRLPAEPAPTLPVLEVDQTDAPVIAA
jgi:hypothetical protein